MLLEMCAIRLEFEGSSKIKSFHNSFLDPHHCELSKIEPIWGAGKQTFASVNTGRGSTEQYKNLVNSSLDGVSPVQFVDIF